MSWEVKDELFESLTPAAVEWVESQADAAMRFTVESRELLRQDAHSVANRLFAIVGAIAAYVITKGDGDAPPWIRLVFLLSVATIAAYVAWRLLEDVRPREATPPGNEPENLLRPDVVGSRQAMQLRSLELLQEQIKGNKSANRELATAVNKGRNWMFALAILAAGGSLVCVWLGV